MLINDAFVNDENNNVWRPVRGIELFSAGWCNLNCKYCYIPKEDYLKDVHKEVVEKIKSGGFIKELKNLFKPEDLQYISHWGTEPTLTTKYFKDFYEEAADYFDLERIFLSSNFMTNPENVVKFITEILPKKKLNVGIQFSIDGPAWITDTNRLGGSTELMSKNVKHFIERINELGTVHNIETHVKPTVNEKQIVILSEYNKAKEYYDFFENLFGELHEKNKKNSIWIQTHVDPTLVNPGLFEKETGIAFAKFLDSQTKINENVCYKNIKQPKPPLYNNWKTKIIITEQYYRKHHQYICSAGNNTYALGEKPNALHTCHRTYYLNNEQYTGNTDNFSQVFKDAIESAKLLGKESIVDTTDTYKFLKQLYVDRVGKDFATLRLSNGIAICHELARENLIHKKYRNIKYAYVLLSTIESFQCVVDQKFLSGSYFIPDINLIKMYGNGALEKYIEYYLYNDPGRKL